jgi:2-keto-4-pentenoate hydratase
LIRQVFACEMPPPSDESRMTDQLTDLLHEAASSRRPIEAVPAELVPSDPAQAYSVQSAFAARIGPTVGWKVGRKSANGPITRAPLFGAGTFPSGTAFPRDAFRLWRIEAELIFRISRDLGPGRSYMREDIEAAVDQVSAAFEIVDSRLAAWPDAPPLLTLADLQAHGAMVIGSGTAPLGRGETYEATPIRMTVEGETILDQNGGNAAGDLVDLIAGLANDLSAAGLGLRAGDLVTTGTFNGMYPLEPGHTVTAAFAGIGEVSLTRG